MDTILLRRLARLEAEPLAERLDRFETMLSPPGQRGKGRRAAPMPPASQVQNTATASATSCSANEMIGRRIFSRLSGH